MLMIRMHLAVVAAVGLVALTPAMTSAQVAGRGIKPHTGNEAGTLTPRPSKPLSGLRLSLIGPRGTVVQSVVTDSDGRFTFAATPAGTYHLHKDGIVHRDLAARSSGAIVGIAVGAVITAVKGGVASTPEQGSGDIPVVVSETGTLSGQVVVPTDGPRRAP